MKKISSIVLASFLSLPLVTFAAPANFRELVLTFVHVIEKAIPILLSLTFVVFIFGLLKYVTAGGDEEKTKEGREYIMYGIIGIFVMSSVWGLVNLIVNEFSDPILRL